MNIIGVGDITGIGDQYGIFHRCTASMSCLAINERYCLESVYIVGGSDQRSGCIGQTGYGRRKGEQCCIRRTTVCISWNIDSNLNLRAAFRIDWPHCRWVIDVPICFHIDGESIWQIIVVGKLQGIDNLGAWVARMLVILRVN